MRILALVAFSLLATMSLSTAHAEPTEKRVALVIGNAAYPSAALATTANDAGLIAQTLQAAGFDVVGARDLDQDTLRRTFRDFLDKVTASGPDTVAFVYISGYGVQLEGDNYIVPVDARLARDTDVPLEALRLSDYTRPLAAMKIKAGIVVLDAARTNSFAQAGQPLASGLALNEPEPHMLVAFNAAPGTVAPAEKGPYGAYAQALAEMIRTGGLPLNDVFERTRLRVNEMTKGGEVPWHASKVEVPIVFFDRAADAPTAAVSSDQSTAMRTRPIRDIGAEDGYVAALERDTLQGYLDFLAAYPNDPMAKRIRAIVAARREALTWRRTRSVDTPPAYWSYLRRYPYGPHVADARRRLAFLAAAFDPPPTFSMISYELPPPPVEEEIYFRRPILVFDDPDYGFAPPPPPPVFFLPPPPPDFVILPPPPPVYVAYMLPIPDYVPLPVYYLPPVYVAPPPPNLIYNNIHNTVIVNNTTNMVTITRPGGSPQIVTPAQAVVAPLPASAPAGSVPAATPPAAAVTPQLHATTPAVSAAALLAPRLPTPVVSKVNANPALLAAPTGRPGAMPGAATTPAKLPSPADKPAAAPLPGAPGGQPLPSGAQPTGQPAAIPLGSSASSTARVTSPTGAPSPAPSNGRPIAPAAQAQQAPVGPAGTKPAEAAPPKSSTVPPTRVAPAAALSRDNRGRPAASSAPPVQRIAPVRQVPQAAPAARPARAAAPPMVRQPPPQIARPAPVARPAPPPRMAAPIAHPSSPPRVAPPRQPAPPPRAAPAKQCPPGQPCR